MILDGNPDENLIKELLVRFSKKAKIKKESGEKVDLIPPDDKEFGEKRDDKSKISYFHFFISSI